MGMELLVGGGGGYLKKKKHILDKTFVVDFVCACICYSGLGLIVFSWQFLGQVLDMGWMDGWG